MSQKALRISVSLQAETVEAAIAELTERFVRPSKTRARVVKQPTEFCVADLCQALIADWQSGKVTYGQGEITLSFSNREVSLEPDLVIYKPVEGDRFLYAKPAKSSGTSSSSDPKQLSFQDLSQQNFSTTPLEPDIIQALFQTLQTNAEAFEELAAHQRAVESRIAEVVQENRKLRSQLEQQKADFAQILANQITSTALHFTERLTELEAQVKAIAHQLEELNLGGGTEPLLQPQSEAEWLQRIKSTWGTVGDYEQYSDSYREANAATPLYDPPDWIALCELEWVRRLSPTLATLYQAIYDKEGLGYEGANILHQFGKHLDPDTEQPYYIYHRSGFKAYDALWQTVCNPNHSWLKELRRIASWGKRHPELFQLFGWEAEAIASLESVIERAYREQQANYDTRNQSQKTTANTLSDYLAILNLGPFSPITVESIKRAYRQAMKTAHPDAGGTKEQAQRVNEAYQSVMRHYFPKAT